MFENCIEFNQPLNSWDVSNVTSMESMFDNCQTFNQPLDRWNVSNEEFGYMFDGCKSFNQSLQKWKISVFADADNIFANCGDDLLRTYPKLKDNL